MSNAHRPTYLTMVEYCTKAVDVDPEYFTPWEQKFIGDMAGWFKLKNYRGSDLQQQHIERIYEKAKRR